MNWPPKVTPILLRGVAGLIGEIGDRTQFWSLLQYKIELPYKEEHVNDNTKEPHNLL